MLASLFVLIRERCMYKQLCLGCFCFFTSVTFATDRIHLQDKPVSFLATFIPSIHATQKLINIRENTRETDFNGTLHIRAQQYVDQYPVLNSNFVIHVTKDKQDAFSSLSHLIQTNKGFMNGNIYHHLEKDIQQAPPFIFEHSQKDQALKQAIQLYNHPNSQISDIENQLAVYVDKNQKAHWVYAIHFIAYDNYSIPEKPSYLLDAITLKSYHYWNDVQTFEEVKAGGVGGNYRTGDILYDGLKDHLSSFSIQRDPDAKICYMRDNDVVLRDMRNNLDVIQYNCSIPSIKHNNLYWNDQDHQSNDAFFAAHVAMNMYQNWYAVPVWMDKTGHPKTIMFWMHHNKPLEWSSDGYENFAGCLGTKYVIIADGDSTYYPFSSLDMIVHEISHGFTTQHSNLSRSSFYEDTEQAAAINESFSDMAAKTAEYFVYGKNQNWMLGALTRDEKRWVRYMDKPSLDCQWKKSVYSDCSIDNVKDFTSMMSSHYASGIFNKAFYLIATSSGWNTKMAFDVMVQANRYYWVPNTTFCAAARNVMQAAKDYRYDEKVIANAFSQVGINVAQCQ